MFRYLNSGINRNILGVIRDLRFVNSRPIRQKIKWIYYSDRISFNGYSNMSIPEKNMVVIASMGYH
jgi:hypothetical protein